MSTDPIQIILLILVGLCAGVIGGFLGIGGCVIMLPALHFLFHVPLPVAVGTTITAVIITAASGAVAHVRVRNVDYRTATIVATSGTLGAVVGSVVFPYIASQKWLLDIILGLAFLYASVRMLYEGIIKQVRREETRCIPGGILSKSLIGFAVGVLSGIVGLGGGYALVPAFVYLLKSGIKIAVGTSLLSFLPLALVSGLFKIVQGYVDVISAIALGVGTAVGAQVGARLVPKVRAHIIKLVFGIIFTVVSLKFLLSGVYSLLS